MKEVVTDFETPKKQTKLGWVLLTLFFQCLIWPACANENEVDLQCEVNTVLTGKLTKANIHIDITKKFVRFQDNLQIIEFQDGTYGKAVKHLLGDNSGLYFKEGHQYVDVREDVIYYGLKSSKGEYFIAHKLDRKTGFITFTNGRQYPCSVMKPQPF